MDKIAKVCLMIKNAFGIDVELIDKDLNVIMQMSSYEYPEFITRAKKELYITLDSRLRGYSKNYFCYHRDSYELCYIAMGVWENGKYEGVIIVGPFISDMPSENAISSIIYKNYLPITNHESLRSLYKGLKFVGEGYAAIGSMLVNLDVDSLENTQVIISQSKEVEPKSKVTNDMEKEREDGSIILKYKIEKQLLHAIEMGNKQEALALMLQFISDFSYRVPHDRIRAHKNMNYTFNTLLRTAVERGGVSPLAIHSLSEKFALLTEKATSLKELDDMKFTMIEEYCDAVNDLSHKGYSHIVKEAIRYIQFNFNLQLNLRIVAEKICFNPTYLAKKFKEETGMTVVEFINKKRVEEAIFLMKQDKLSITNISLLVGFNSYNYFCKVFKEVMGITATEYISGLS